MTTSLDEFEAQLQATVGWVSLEDLVTSEQGFGLSTATPVQRAWCWVLQDNTVPDHLWEVHEVQETFGFVRPQCRSLHAAREVLFLAGVRGAKTLICAAACVWFAMKAVLDVGVGKYMKKGERPRVSLVSASKDNAKEAYNYIVGAMTDSPRLAPLLLGQPRRDGLTIRHPSGRKIDIKIVAMSGRQGVNLVSRWCAAVLFDEAPRMAADDADGKVNLDGMVKGVRTRLLPGAPIMYIGSPVGAVGYVWKLYENNYGKSPNRVTVGQAKGRWLNPVHWTPEREQELHDNPKTYDEWLTDCEAKFRDVESQFFSSAMVDASFRRDPLIVGYEEGCSYTAVMDPGMTRNAWVMAIAKTDENVKFQIVRTWEKQGSKAQPVNSIEAIKEIKELMAEYRINTVMTDQYASEPLRDIGNQEGVHVVPSPFSKQNKLKRYKAVETRLNARYLEFPFSDDFRNDLLNVKQVIRSDGTPEIRLVETEDGRHCDFAAVLALLCGGYIEESDVEAFKREQGELPSEDEELFGTDNSFAAVAAREWNGDDERDDAGRAW